MEKLYINGKSLSYADRSVRKRDNTSQLKFHKKFFVPFKSSTPVQVIHNSKVKPRVCFRESKEFIDYNRKVLRRPQRFKNYYTDRQPLSIKHFEFPRLGEQLIYDFRGQQALCKYYSHNEVIDAKLFAESIQDIERILYSRFHYRRSESIEPYYETSAILVSSLRALANETCLCSKDYYRLNCCIHEDIRLHCKKYPLLRKGAIQTTTSTTPSTTTTQAKVTTTKTSNAIKRLAATKSSLEHFICLASECYNRCIQHYLNNLNDCNRRIERNNHTDKGQSKTDQKKVEKAEPLSSQEQTHREEKENTSSLTVEEQPLINQLNKLNINLHHTTCEGDTETHEKEKYTRQSIAIHTQCRSPQAMSCSDSNNNDTESTNHIRDPPKIIFSDFTAAKQQTQDKSDKDISDNRSAIDKNCLAIPISNYCSEARPP